MGYIFIGRFWHKKFAAPFFSACEFDVDVDSGVD
jgi:hypothetical protein